VARQLEALGWFAFCAHGADEGIKSLRSLGTDDRLHCQNRFPRCGCTPTVGVQVAAHRGLPHARCLCRLRCHDLPARLRPGWHGLGEATLRHEESTWTSRTLACVDSLGWFAAYLCFPAPVVFAWFRWKAEREAYLENILHDGYDLRCRQHAVRGDCLTCHGWMRKWFETHATLQRM